MGMSQGRFEVIIEGDEVRYVESETVTVQRLHTFRIKLVNNSHAVSHASVSIDGEHIGTWKLDRTSWLDVTIDPRTMREFQFSKRGKYTLLATFEHQIFGKLEESDCWQSRTGEEESSLDICVN